MDWELHRNGDHQGHETFINIRGSYCDKCVDDLLDPESPDHVRTIKKYLRSPTDPCTQSGYDDDNDDDLDLKDIVLTPQCTDAISNGEIIETDESTTILLQNLNANPTNSPNTNKKLRKTANPTNPTNSPESAQRIKKKKKKKRKKISPYKGLSPHSHSYPHIQHNNASSPPPKKRKINHNTNNSKKRSSNIDNQSDRDKELYEALDGKHEKYFDIIYSTKNTGKAVLSLDDMRYYGLDSSDLNCKVCNKSFKNQNGKSSHNNISGPHQTNNDVDEERKSDSNTVIVDNLNEEIDGDLNEEIDGDLNEEIDGDLNEEIGDDSNDLNDDMHEPHHNDIVTEFEKKCVELITVKTRYLKDANYNTLYNEFKQETIDLFGDRKKQKKQRKKKDKVNRKRNQEIRQQRKDKDAPKGRKTNNKSEEDDDDKDNSTDYSDDDLH